jgi:transposase
MSKKSSLGAAERTALVLRLLAKEEPAAQIARRAGVSETTFRWREQFIEGGAARVAGNGTPKAEAREIERLKRALAKRDQVIGELTIANRLWGKLPGDGTP